MYHTKTTLKIKRMLITCAKTVPKIQTVYFWIFKLNVFSSFLPLNFSGKLVSLPCITKKLQQWQVILSENKRRAKYNISHLIPPAIIYWCLSVSSFTSTPPYILFLAQYLFPLRGPIRFNFQKIWNVIFLCYADDSQIYFFLEKHSTPSLKDLLDCLVHLKSLLGLNFIRVYDQKTGCTIWTLWPSFFS